jgi:drug/metabolite transporter (DMT)-like permease
MLSTAGDNELRRRHAAFALFSAVLFGISAPAAKLLLQTITPQLLAGLLYIGSGLGLSVLWLARRHNKAQAPLGRSALPWLGGAIAFGGVLAPLLLMLGLSRTPASAASLLLSLEGVFTALLAWFVFRENFDRRIALGMLAILAGGAVLSWQGSLAWGGVFGPLTIAAATLCWAVDNNLTQKVSAGDPVQIAAIKGVVAGSVNLGIALSLGASLPIWSRLGAGLLVGFVSYGMSLVFFILALRHLGTARTAAYFSTAPFIGAVVAIAVFHEPVTRWLLLSGTLMALGVWLHLMERHEHEHVHEVLEHEHLHLHDEHHRHLHAPGDPPGEPHSHPHRHEPLVHVHAHYPDIHHRHGH